MPTTGGAVVIEMPTEEETTLVEKIGDALHKLAMAWWHMLGWGIILGAANLALLLQLNRKGATRYYVEVGSEEASIVVTLAAFIVLVAFWTGVAYIAYFRRHRRRRIAELQQLAQNSTVWATVEKLRQIEEVVGPLERFDWILDRLQRPDRFTRRHLAPLLRPL